MEVRSKFNVCKKKIKKEVDYYVYNNNTNKGTKAITITATVTNTGAAVTAAAAVACQVGKASPVSVYVHEFSMFSSAHASKNFKRDLKICNESYVHKLTIVS